MAGIRFPLPSSTVIVIVAVSRGSYVSLLVVRFTTRSNSTCISLLSERKIPDVPIANTETKILQLKERFQVMQQQKKGIGVAGDIATSGGLWSTHQPT